LLKASPDPSVPAVVHHFSHVHSLCRSVSWELSIEQTTIQHPRMILQHPRVIVLLLLFFIILLLLFLLLLIC